MKSRDVKIDRLASVELFRGCSRADLAKIARITDQVDLPAGRVLFEQGRVGLECFVLIDGAAEVRVGDKPIATVGAGESVGEMSLLDRRPRSATVVTTEPSQAYVIDARHFAALLDASPSIAKGLLRELSSRIRDLDLDLATTPA